MIDRNLLGVTHRAQETEIRIQTEPCVFIVVQCVWKICQRRSELCITLVRDDRQEC